MLPLPENTLILPHVFHLSYVSVLGEEIWLYLQLNASILDKNERKYIIMFVKLFSPEMPCQQCLF